ncbi:transposase [Novosphingobium chloroacetimidivorans]|uniref:Transposase n=1 Tax=Novosphingobium chloroacetimidivorans TaxID=1428314 RepID=A0A7W7KEQ9_9SPHN|nr:hypothetical protein [Novosphingobium chloroacetimidivorans]MBB4861061.1 transposase [Novosphingobium chloroacetimidivorans]
MGEADHDGHVSRRGDTHLRRLHYEAAMMLLTRIESDFNLRKIKLAAAKATRHAGVLHTPSLACQL